MRPEQLLGVVAQIDGIATDGVVQSDHEQGAGERATVHARAYRPGRAAVAMILSIADLWPMYTVVIGFAMISRGTEKPNAPVSRGVQPTE